MKIHGVIPILQTPFAGDGAVDFDSMANQVDHLATIGIEAVAFPGFVSEWWKLSSTEIHALAKTIAGRARGRMAVIFNVTSQSTRLATEEARAFAALGADALMCLPPYAVPAAPDAVLEHLEAVMAATSLPHILQYSESLTGVRIAPAAIASMSRRHSNFTCVKVDFIPPAPMVTALANAIDDPRFTFLIGYSGLQLADCMARGASGLMGGAGHAKQDMELFRALTSDPAAGRDSFRRLLPLLNFEMQTLGLCIAVHKRLLLEQGVFRADHVRKPGSPLDARRIEELHTWLPGAGATLL